MKKPLLIIGGISLAGILLFPIGAAGNANDYLTGVGVCAFLGAGLLLLIGFLLLVISIGAKEVRPYGAACMLVAGLLLVSGFTLCSTAQAHLGHM